MHATQDERERESRGGREEGERWAKRKKWKNVSGERARAKLKMRQRTGAEGERERGREGGTEGESKKWTHPRNLSARSNSDGRTDLTD